MKSGWRSRLQTDSLLRCLGCLFLVLKLGEDLAQSDAGGEEAAIDLSFGNPEEFGYGGGGVALDVAHKKQEALGGGKLLDSLFKVSTPDVPPGKVLIGWRRGWSRGCIGVEGKALLQLLNQG